MNQSRRGAGEGKEEKEKRQGRNRLRGVDKAPEFEKDIGEGR